MHNRLGLYIHIPFCEKKCDYCDFNSAVADEAAKERYARALLKQIKQYALQAEKCLVDTLFIGGGTPACLGEKELLRVIKTVKKSFNLSPMAEITVEANPHSALTKILKALRKAGVNRLSLGLQTTDDQKLQALGRMHSYKDFEESYQASQAAGFENINIDLIYGLPGQTTDDFLESLRMVIELAPRHISCYALKIEEGTPFFERQESLNLPSEETVREMYIASVQELCAAGFEQYEISNFAARGAHCRHNLKYWRCEPYLGLGSGSHSYFYDKRFSFVRDTEAFVKGIEQDTVIVDEYQEISEGERLGEYVMLMLRLNEGIDFAVFSRRFHRDFEGLFGAKTEKFLSTGYMRKTPGGIAFTTDGFLISNYILADLLNL